MRIGDASVSKADGSQSLDLKRDALRAEGIADAAPTPTTTSVSMTRLMKGLDEFLERDTAGLNGSGRPAILKFSGD